MDYPTELRGAGYLIGVHWPDGDEDAMRQLSRAYLQARDELEALRPDLTGLAQGITQAYPQGDGGTAIQDRITQLITAAGGFDDLVAGLGELGRAADDMATQLESMKLNFSKSLAKTAGDLAAASALPPGAQEAAEESIIALGEQAAATIAQRGVRAIEESAPDAAWVGQQKFASRPASLPAASDGLQGQEGPAHESLDGQGLGANSGEAASIAPADATGAVTAGALGANTMDKFTRAIPGPSASGPGLAEDSDGFRAVGSGGIGPISSPVAAEGMWADSSAASAQWQPVDASPTADAFQGTVNGETNEWVAGTPEIRTPPPVPSGGEANQAGVEVAVAPLGTIEANIGGARAGNVTGPIDGSRTWSPSDADQTGDATADRELSPQAVAGQTDAAAGTLGSGTGRSARKQVTRRTPGTRPTAANTAAALGPGADPDASSTVAQPAPVDPTRASAPATDSGRQDAAVSAGRSTQAVSTVSETPALGTISVAPVAPITPQPRKPADTITSTASRPRAHDRDPDGPRRRSPAGSNDNHTDDDSSPGPAQQPPTQSESHLSPDRQPDATGDTEPEPPQHDFLNLFSE